MARDRVERTIDELRATRDELDTQPAEAVLRVLLLGRTLEQRIGDTLEPFGLQVWEFDVLAALRRQGAPYCLPCGDLARQVVITCSGMTHRVSRLAERGLVVRTRDDSDRRTVFVALTDDGRELVDQAIERRLGDSAELLGALDSDERAALIALLRRMNEAAGGD
jgi:DNA-binding MarR family transcriptional regulator